MVILHFCLLFTELYDLNQTFCFLFMYLLLPEMCKRFDMKLSAFVHFLGTLRLFFFGVKISWQEICEYNITLVLWLNYSSSMVVLYRLVKLKSKR